jgi:putative FmdB family regulatory protein
MPFYEYQCSACGAHVEVLQKITDAPLKKCPRCAQNKLKKLVSAPVFRLKGGGWYETDFKTDKDTKRNLVDSDRGEAKAEGKTEGKADEKAAPKPEARADGKADATPQSKPAAKPVSASTRRARPAARKPVKRKAAK